MDIPQQTERLQVTIDEAAYMLSFKRRTIYNLLAEGKLTSTGHGQGRRIPMSSLRRFIEENERSHAEPTYEG